MTSPFCRAALLMVLTGIAVSGCRTTTAELKPASGAAAAVPRQPAAIPGVTAPRESPAYVFGWGSVPGSLASPRGGTSHGAPVSLAAPRALPLPEIKDAPNAFERDRVAILALAGDYRVSFHFMEIAGLTRGYAATRPYHSWATEHVRVIEDSGRRISLQHTLVMFFGAPDGSASPPAVMKHWRQDWTYEDSDLHTFRGNRTWARRRVSAAEAAGQWSQAVFQVDDSPRYEALGRWTHRGNLSAWTGENAWRPLPRREHTTRDDYDVMEGVHRIVITPTGWLHLQDNLKRVAGETGGIMPEYLAQETGVDRYERIDGPALTAADAYWEKTSGYWEAVRRAWSDLFASRERFTLVESIDGKQRFAEHFAFAERLNAGELFNAAAAARHARETIERYVQRASVVMADY